jgi:hypothetical protein
MADRDDSWYRRAACRGLPTALFFPDPARPDPVAVAQAKAVCTGCGVRWRCLAAAEQEGIWGGLSAAERRETRVRQQDRQGAAA